MATGIGHHSHVGDADVSYACQSSIRRRVAIQEDDVHAVQVDWITHLILGLHLLEHPCLGQSRHDV